MREDTLVGGSAPGVNLSQVARIVSSYVRHHQLGPDQLAGLIVAVHRALANLGLGHQCRNRLNRRRLSGDQCSATDVSRSASCLRRACCA